MADEEWNVGPQRWVFAVVIVASIIAFSLVFVFAWLVSKLLWPTVFPMLKRYDKADWCSRVGSTLHSLIVVPGFIITMFITEWDNYWPVDEGSDPVSAARFLMAISMGYFVVDFVIICVYRVPLWIVFVVHHVVAMIPFFIHLFMTSCRAATFVLEGFLLVEVANIFLNTLSWFDKAGRVKSWKYALVFYINYIVWIPARMGIPVFMVVVIYKSIFFNKAMFPDNRCLIPGMVCCHIITVFCFVVFIVFLTPDLIKRWRDPKQEGEKADKIARERRAAGIQAPPTPREPFGELSPEQISEGSKTVSTVATPRNLDEVKDYVVETFREMSTVVLPEEEAEEHDRRRLFERGVAPDREHSLHTAASFRP